MEKKRAEALKRQEENRKRVPAKGRVISKVMAYWV
jgi:hypothetical protein